MSEVRSDGICETQPDLPEDMGGYDYDDEYEPDEAEEAADNCHGFFEHYPNGGVFWCGAAWSEDCDECPYNSWCGLTSKQIDELEGIESDEG